jgi:hypothetical protein
MQKEEKSGHKRAGKQGELTNWKAQRGGQDRTQEEREQVRGTHPLKNAEGEDQDLKIKVS